METPVEIREIVMRDGKALHAKARGRILQHPVERGHPVWRDPAIGLVERKEAPGIRLHHGNEAQRHPDHVGGAPPLSSSTSSSVPSGRTTQMSRDASPRSVESQRDRLFAGKHLLDERGEQGLGLEVAAVGGVVNVLDQGLDFALESKPALGESTSCVRPRQEP